ncbi:hypothetical protein ACFFX0_01800 [Citricoccus parietis]|uniref:Uncharacterized protein n=1 Tax=Citricoccus parietis TaxID=592307 RepID=A0ABV5FTJ7_9MICC
MPGRPSVNWLSMISGVLPMASVMLFRMLAKTVFLPETAGVGKPGDGSKTVLTSAYDRPMLSEGSTSHSE